MYPAPPAGGAGYRVKPKNINKVSNFSLISSTFCEKVRWFSVCSFKISSRVHMITYSLMIWGNHGLVNEILNSSRTTPDMQTMIGDHQYGKDQIFEQVLTHWRWDFLDSGWCRWRPSGKPWGHRHRLRDCPKRSPCWEVYRASLSAHRLSKCLEKFKFLVVWRVIFYF
jgi:hypothetical protein